MIGSCLRAIRSALSTAPTSSATSKSAIQPGGARGTRQGIASTGRPSFAPAIRVTGGLPRSAECESRVSETGTGPSRVGAGRAGATSATSELDVTAPESLPRVTRVVGGTDLALAERTDGSSGVAEPSSEALASGREVGSGVPDATTTRPVPDLGSAASVPEPGWAAEAGGLVGSGPGSGSGVVVGAGCSAAGGEADAGGGLDAGGAAGAGGGLGALRGGSNSSGST